MVGSKHLSQIFDIMFNKKVAITKVESFRSTQIWMDIEPFIITEDAKIKGGAIKIIKWSEVDFNKA